MFCSLLTHVCYFAVCVDTTVLFADIVGFEAWSSQREPTQCLTLLETIYDAFDREARLQGVFKVEAVADCYTGKKGNCVLLYYRLVVDLC